MYILEKQEERQPVIWVFLIETSIPKPRARLAQTQNPAHLDHCKHMAGLLFWFLNLDLEMKTKFCMLQ